MFASTRNHSNVYRQLNTETVVHGADPHRLVAMLFEGALGALSAARGALERGDIGTKAVELSRAGRIVEEGLRGGLNRQAGGALADSLDALYTYVNGRILHANLRNDANAMRECVDLLQPIHEAWTAIRTQVMGGQPAAAPALAQAYQPVAKPMAAKQFAYV